MNRVLVAGFSQDLAANLQDHLGDCAVEHAHTETWLYERLQGNKDCSLLVLDARFSGGTGSKVLRFIEDLQHRAGMQILYCAATPEEAAASTLPENVECILYPPFDADTLAEQAASLLPDEQQTGPADSFKVSEKVARALAPMWQRSREKMLDQLTILQSASTALQEGTLAESDRHAAEREAHKLAGGLGMFGLVEAASLARSIEAFLRHIPKSGPGLGKVASSPSGSKQEPGQSAHESDNQHEANDLSNLIHRLAGILEASPTFSPVADFPSETSADHGTAADPTASPRLLIIDVHGDLVPDLRNEVTAAGITVATVSSVEAAQKYMQEARPHVVMLDPFDSDGNQDLLAFARRLASIPTYVPVIACSARSSFTDRLAVARAGCSAFLQRPLRPTQVVETVRGLLDHSITTNATVLTVDDDPQIAVALDALLSPIGIHLRHFQAPAELWHELEQTIPDMVILDIDMPEVNGIELCRMIRNHPRCKEIPVLFLTGYTDAETIRQVFAAGGDDFVPKPIMGPDLITRIMNRLERVRLHRTLAEQDPLTGVANRRKSTEVLSMYLRMADREARPLSLAVLDIDLFKQVNDRFGHSAGDDVLRFLGESLNRSLRGDDVVARWGGEEFLVGMYGSTNLESIPRLHAVLEALRRQEFLSPDREAFRVTFSAGLSEFPRDGRDLIRLYQTADRALYKAKAAGRNRIVAVGLSHP